MDFRYSARAEEFRGKLVSFMEDHVLPAEPVYWEQARESETPFGHPPVMEELEAEARRRGLWNLFLPNPLWGAGLSNLDYAPLAEITGWSPAIAIEREGNEYVIDGRKWWSSGALSTACGPSAWQNGPCT